MSSDVSILKLKRGEDRRIRSGHLWVFSNEIDNAATPLTGFAAGARARVVSDRDQFLGHAYVNPHALICARIVGRDAAQPLDRALIEQRLKVALALRERVSRAPYYRLVFGESDQLPGLVLDRYGDVLVGQIATAGMEALKADVEAAVRTVINRGRGVRAAVSGSVGRGAEDGLVLRSNRQSSTAHPLSTARRARIGRL
jgi:23S rRNA (cytosine1962-C5)-methyltransferase